MERDISDLIETFTPDQLGWVRRAAFDQHGAQAWQKDGVTRFFPPGMAHFKRLGPDRMGWERREDLDGLGVTMWRRPDGRLHGFPADAPCRLVVSFEAILRLRQSDHPFKFRKDFRVMQRICDG
jgi:hypothetical protein